MNKTISMLVGAIIIVGAVAFYGGVQYGKNSATSGAGQQGGAQNGRGAGYGRRGTGGAGAPAGFVNGSVIAKDDKSITVQGRDNNTTIVFFATSTTVMKSVDGSVADVAVGNDVVINGDSTSDGIITAKSIQIRPAGAAQKSGAQGQ